MASLAAVLPSIFASAALVLYAVVWTVGLVGTVTIHLRYSASRRTRVAALFPSSHHPFGVSILRPLKGLDPQLHECLESAFQQNYPLFEIILSVADEFDPAVKVAKTLIAKYPNVSARLIIGISHTKMIARIGD
jgi:ceramide glucosyltransferase